MFNKHEGYDADGTAFKHLETTKRISVTFKQKRGDYTYKPQPNPSHNYVAKIANKNGYLKDCPVKLEGNRFIISTADLVDLTVGRYYLEVWESYQDDTGKDQLSIYPSPDSRVDFDIEPNIMETTGETIKELGFQDLVDATAKKVNLSITLGDTDILPAGSKPSVSESRQDDKLVLTFHLPAGSTGNTSGGTTNIDVSNYYTKQEVDTKLQNYAKKSELPDTSKFVTTNDVPTVSLSLSNRTITVNGTTLAIPDSVDLSGYATKQEIPKLVYDASSHSLTINGQQISLPSNVDLSDYYTKEQVDSKVAQAATGGKVDLTGYLTKAEASKTYATKDELPSVSGLAKESDLPKITLDTEKRIITINGKSITIPDNVNLDSVKTSAYPVSEGESPSATLAKAQDGTYVISFGVPQGATGPAGHDGKNGSDGTTPHVDTATGDWFLGDKDTGVHAKGEQGKTGQTGKDGITPHIGDNGDWFLGDQDTGKPSQGKQGPQGEPGKDGQQGAPGASGKDGDTPYIGSNGNWYLSSRDTGKPSQGRAGNDGNTLIMVLNKILTLT